MHIGAIRAILWSLTLLWRNRGQRVGLHPVLGSIAARLSRPQPRHVNDREAQPRTPRAHRASRRPHARPKDGNPRATSPKGTNQRYWDLWTNLRMCISAARRKTLSAFRRCQRRTYRCRFFFFPAAEAARAGCRRDLPPSPLPPPTFDTSARAFFVAVPGSAVSGSSG